MTRDYTPAAPPASVDGDLARYLIDELQRIEARTNDVGWRDIEGQITVRVVGSGRPTWAQIGGTIYYAYQFATGDQCWVYYHIPHDVVPREDVYFHAHWITDGTDTNTVRWLFDATHAHGFDQEAFSFGSPEVAATVDQAGPGVQYQHMIAETTGQDLGIAEPDGLVAVRITRLPNGGTDNADAVFLLLADIHYKSDSKATPGKAPDFYRLGQ